MDTWDSKELQEMIYPNSLQNVLQYDSIKRVENKVEKIEKDTNNDLFLITTTTTTTSTTKSSFEENDIHKIDDRIVRKSKARARYLIISTGVMHLKPNIKNFENYDGNGIWHCPHCDGFETVNKKLIIIASDSKNNDAIDYAKVFLGGQKISLYSYSNF